MLRKRLLLIIAFTMIFYSKAFTQPNKIKFDKYISDSIMSVLKVGVYLTHDEFLTNNPSYNENFKILLNHQIIYNEFQQLSDVVILNEGSQNAEIITSLWGVYDGNNLLVFNGKLLFKIKYYGRYNLCWVERIKTVKKYVNLPTREIPFYNPKNVSKRKILDFKTNKWYEYDVEYLKFLMKNCCPYYYKLYKMERNKKRKLSLYLRKINALE